MVTFTILHLQTVFGSNDKNSSGKGLYVIVDKITQYETSRAYITIETSTSQNRLLTSTIGGELSASTTCRRQILRCCDKLAESVYRCQMFGVGFLFAEENRV